MIRLPLILLLLAPATLLPQPAEARVGAIDIPALVGQILVTAFEDVGGSPVTAGSREVEERAATVPPETHPTPVAVEQEADLPLPPAAAPNPRPQTAPPPQPTKSGKASWYGERFAGRKTASGERFNPQAMTTAHKTLPFGTDLEVCRQGQCVEVRVTDRGPASWTGRDLDLSRAAFAALAPLSAGVVSVTWEVT